MGYAEGEIRFRYRWPLGQAEERFFDELKARAVLTGARCNSCNRLMVPPRSFCEECFGNDIDYVEVPSRGVLQTFAESYFSLDGKQLDEPFVLGIIRLNETHGGLLHRIDPKGRKLEIGMEMQAVFEDQRSGNILDIGHFEPA